MVERSAFKNIKINNENYLETTLSIPIITEDIYNKYFNFSNDGISNNNNTNKNHNDIEIEEKFSKKYLDIDPNDKKDLEHLDNYIKETIEETKLDNSLHALVNKNILARRMKQEFISFAFPFSLFFTHVVYSKLKKNNSSYPKLKAFGFFLLPLSLISGVGSYSTMEYNNYILYDLNKGNNEMSNSYNDFKTYNRLV